MSKKRYKSLKLDELTMGDALEQAARSADLAGEMAVNSDDFVKVAGAWKDIAEVMLGIFALEQNEESEDNEGKKAFGFGPGGE